MNGACHSLDRLAATGRLLASAGRFAAEAAAMPGDAWTVQVRALRGPGFRPSGCWTGGCPKSKSTTWTSPLDTRPATGRPAS
jgi:hypothetical protein